jgi:hypothetical protein
VANLPLRLAVRVHCGQAKFGGVHVELLNGARTVGYPMHTLGVYRHCGTHGTTRREECVAVGRARLPSFSCRSGACAAE